jgi:hypothetical protein
MEAQVVWHGALWREIPPPPKIVKVTVVQLPTERPSPVMDSVLQLFEEHGPLTRNEAFRLSPLKPGAVNGAIERLYKLKLIVRSHRVKGSWKTSWAYKVAEE